MSEKEVPVGVPIPIKDILSDPTHPAYNYLMEMIEKLKKGEIHLS